MTEMVERVARVLARNEEGGRWGGFSDRIKALYLEEARSAIEAMREPTEAMNRAGECEGPGPGEQTDATAIFRAMIDAALSPGEQDG